MYRKGKHINLTKINYLFENNQECFIKNLQRIKLIAQFD
jgi:hypothetical protein